MKEVCQDLFTPSLETACTNEREKLAPANLLLKNSFFLNPSCSFDICASINWKETSSFAYQIKENYKRLSHGSIFLLQRR